MSAAARPLDVLALPLRGSHLIEASAGTGKTWTIAALYVRLVLGHYAGTSGFGRPLLPTEILVVTFTEAATEELRARIRARLTEAARCFRGQATPDPFLTGLLAAYPREQHPGLARRLAVAAEWMDEAAIHTIHGWCNRMLRRHAFESGCLFDLAIADTDQELIAEAARDYWRKFFYPLPALAVVAVNRIAESPAALLGKVAPLLHGHAGDRCRGGQKLSSPRAPAEILAEWIQWQEKNRELERAARLCWAEHRTELEDMLWDALRKKRLNGTRYPERKFAERLAEFAVWATGSGELRAEHRRDFAKGSFQLNSSGAGQEPRHEAFELLAEWHRHAADEPEPWAEILVHAADWIDTRYGQEKSKRSRLDYDDLPALLDRALQGEHADRLAEAIVGQFPVALIDEFQDTDPIQFRIFDAIYRVSENPDDRALLLIGDPKQAIYSFRGADLHTYLRARAATSGRHYTLDRNFRSTTELVAAVNRIFGRAEDFPAGAFNFGQAGTTSVPYLRVRAQGRPERFLVDGQPVPALQFWHRATNEPLGMTRYREELAAATAEEIVGLLSRAERGQAKFSGPDGDRPLQAAAIAVLVRDGAEAEAMREALASRGVRSVYWSLKDSVYQTAEARDLGFWLQAAAEPERERKLRAALATATLDLGLERLDQLGQDELAFEAEVERFRGYGQIWRQQGVMPMLYRLLGDFDVPARLLARAGGERSLTNLLHLAELLQRASMGLDGEQALIRHLAEAMEPGAGGDEEALQRLESDAELVKIVTIHKSKGLEFPLVFLPFACAFKEAKPVGGGFLRYHDDEGRAIVDFEGGSDALVRSERERLQEDIRLLYVALTRACHACWVGVAPVKRGNTKKCQLEKSALGYLLNGAEPIEPNELGNYLSQLRGQGTEIAVTGPPAVTGTAYQPVTPLPVLRPARVYDGPRPARWWIASYSALRWGMADTPTAEAPASPAEANLMEAAGSGAPVAAPSRAGGLHEFPAGPQAGVFLHGLLEWAAREGFAAVVADATRRRDTIARRCQNRGWSHWIDPLDGWLQRLLTTSLSLGQTQVCLRDLESVQPELEFWLAAGGAETQRLDELVSKATLSGRPRPPVAAECLEGMFKGYIDLAFAWEKRYYLLDYKSNRLGTGDADYDEAAMAAAMVENRYDLQYCLYLLALHRQLRARLGPAYDYDTHIGGVVYLFLRGLGAESRGVFFDRPPRDLIEELDQLFRTDRETKE